MASRDSVVPRPSLEIPRFAVKRLFAIGDVHGCIDELRELLALIDDRFVVGEDMLMFLGDLVDRGPGSIEVVELVKALCDQGVAKVVSGNHDSIYPSYKDGKNVALHGAKAELYAKMNNAHFDFLRSNPHAIRFDIEGQGRPWVAVHAGLEPAFPLEQQDPYRLERVRIVHPDTGLMVYREKVEVAVIPVFWTKRYQGSENVVYGHFVHDLEKPLIEQNDLMATTIGLDTGCCFGGHLTAAIIGSSEKPDFIQVKAAKSYARLRPNTYD